MYLDLWNSIKDVLFAEMDNFLANLKDSPLAETLNECRKATASKWYGENSYEYIKSDIYTEIDGMREWFNGRKNWMSENTDNVFTSISKVTTESQEPHAIYDIQGKKVPTMSQNGIYIFNKKKTLYRK
jgi:hypothetical protein